MFSNGDPGNFANSESEGDLLLSTSIGERFSSTPPLCQELSEFV